MAVTDNTAETSKIKGAGKATLNITKGAYENSLLQDALGSVAKNPINVSEGKITLDETDVEAVTVMLATVGLEVLDGNKTQASADGDADEEVEAKADEEIDAFGHDKDKDKDEDEVEAMEKDGDMEDEVEAMEKPAGDKVEDYQGKMDAPDSDDMATAGEIKNEGPALEKRLSYNPGETDDSVDKVTEEPKMKTEASTEDSLYATAEQKMGLADQYDMILSRSANDDAHWIVIAGGEPVARITLSAQENSSALAKFFKQEDYGHSITASFDKNGIAKTLELLRAEIFSDKPLQPKVEANLDDVRDAAVRKFQHCFGMATEAANKNVIDNHLKAAAFEVLTDNNIQDVQAVVEAIFAKMPEYLQVINEHTLKYMGMSKDGLQATESMLSEMGVQIRSDESVQATTNVTYMDTLVSGNMPLTVPVAEKVNAEVGSSDGVRNLVRSGLNSKYPKQL